MPELPLSHLFDVASLVIPGREAAYLREANTVVDFSNRFYYVAGAPIIPKPPKQNTDSIDRIYEDSQQATPDYENIVRDAARRIGNGSRSVTFKICPDKHIGRSIVKANSDYDGDYSRVCDIKRASIYFETLAEYERAERLFTPASNSSVIRFQDDIAFPSDNGKPRRLHINLITPNGHVTEIQGRLKGMEKAYKRTEDIYSHIRATNAYLDTHPDCPTYADLTKRVGTWQAERDRIHRQAEEKCGADKAVRDVKFFYVDGVPVVKTYKPLSGEHETLVPDPRTGTFMRDNRFLAMLSDPNRGIDVDVPEIAFRARSAAIIHAPAIQGARNFTM